MKALLSLEYLNETTIFHHEYYKEIRDTVNLQIDPGFLLFHKNILKSIEQRNNINKKIFGIALVIFIFCSVIISIIMWIPYTYFQRELVIIM